jgi:hypothetical protein
MIEGNADLKVVIEGLLIGSILISELLLLGHPLPFPIVCEKDD